MPRFKLIICSIVLLVATGATAAQRVLRYEEQRQGQISLTDDIAIPAEAAGYTLILPEPEAPKGLVVFFNASRDTTGNHFYPLALQQQLGVVYVTSGNRLDFFFDDSTVARIDGYLHRAATQAGVAAPKLFFTGMSLAGTRALKYAIYCLQGKSAYGHQPQAVAVCDAPLDFVRFWHSCDRAKRIRAHDAAANEGEWVTGVLERHLGGAPAENLEAYQRYSIYSHGAKNGGNARWLKTTPVRAYTEPDVQWWMRTRRKDYYDMNAIDAAALVNMLHILGNEAAELIVTHDRGVLPDGTRHPHSWSIVGEGELVAWFVAQL